MRAFSLLACCLCFGMCHAASFDKVMTEQRSSCVKIDKKKCICEIKKGAFGCAVVSLGDEPVCLKSGDSFSFLKAIAVRKMFFADGEFTVQQDDQYKIRFSVKLKATNAVPQSSITVGLVVNGEVVQKEELCVTLSATDALYPFEFSVKNVKALLDLKKGDKVSLKVVDISLPEESQACIVCDADESPIPVYLCIRSVSKFDNEPK